MLCLNDKLLMPFIGTVLVFQQSLGRLLRRLHSTQGCRLDAAQTPLPVTWRYPTFPFRAGCALSALCGGTVCLTLTLTHRAVPDPPCRACACLLAAAAATPANLDPQKISEVQVDFKPFTL